MTILKITNSNSKVNIEASTLENRADATIYTEGSVNVSCNQIKNIHSVPYGITVAYLHCKGSQARANISADYAIGGAICENQSTAVINFKENKNANIRYEIKQGAKFTINSPNVGEIFAENAVVNVETKFIRNIDVSNSDCIINTEEISEGLVVKSSNFVGKITKASFVDIKGNSKVNSNFDFIEQLTVGGSNIYNEYPPSTSMYPSLADITLQFKRIERLFLTEDMKGSIYLTGTSLGLITHNSLMHAYLNVANIGRETESRSIILHSHSSHDGISYPGSGGDGATHGGQTYFGAGGGQEGGLPASKEGTLRIYNAVISAPELNYVPDTIPNDMALTPIYFGVGSTNKRLYLSNCTIRTTSVCCMAKAYNTSTPALYILGTLWVTKPLTVEETQPSYVNNYYGTTVLDPTF